MTTEGKAQSAGAETATTLVLLVLDTIAFFVLWVGVVGLIGWDPGAEAEADLTRAYLTAAAVAAAIGAGSTWFLHSLRFKTATIVHAMLFAVMVFIFATGPQLLDKVVN
ncbi:hypothetical protein [Streptomyces sp. KMM 9044]|uniref:hypothetical protein n=1 Tax=Streptomyces sp. KMM 9044 TaxID=2744474 RepID=UPI0021509B9F|nr:hypothetical protein [Streptomyces sp. KMM 9044]WAX77161.1 hypothetical protein HUV60_005275 [Streptomyces sp. KMM 9044]